MNLPQLIRYINTQAANSFCIRGRYGYVQVTPEQNNRTQQTYIVDSTYCFSGIDSRTDHQPGFRLSTICCLCACILFGETALDEEMIAAINAGCLPG